VAKATCSIDDCIKAAFCRGWCSAHYSRWQRHGDPLYQARQSPRTAADRDKPKRCSRCKQTKPATEFGRNKSRADGLGAWCYTCNSDAVREHNAAYGEARRLARRGYSLYRRNLIEGSRCVVTTADLRRIVNRFGGCCAYCGAPWKQFDHVVPVSRGGRHSVGNIVPACVRCNTSKSDAFITEWRLARSTPSKRARAAARRKT
jgi:5-methylcytosine-specific restriction endonuclease McrA